ncbi:MAG: hypothetical protein AAF192_03370 [Pseudomonadota bacterium]
MRLLAALLLALPGPALAGAWTLPEGEGLTILTLSHTTTDRFFDGLGALDRGADLDKTEASVYLEYGLREGLTAIGQSTLSIRELGGATPDERTGLDYTELGLRARLAQPGPWVVSVQGSARVPGASEPASPAEIGLTEFEADGRLLLGRGFAWGERTGYADLQLGWRQRFDAPPNELRTDLTVGVRPVPEWLLIAQAFGTFADGSARTPFTDASNVKAQLSAAYELAPGWTAQVGAFATVWGEDAAQEVGGLLSLWRAF